MSREERRQYQRQMKSMERGAALPPAAKARAERKAARRARHDATGPVSGARSRRFVVRSVIAAAGIGLIGFSLLWPDMPFAAYVGVGAAVGVLAILLGGRFLMRRARRAASSD